MLPCVKTRSETNITFSLMLKKKTSPDGTLPSPFLSNEGDNGRMSQQVALFFAQKFQQVPGRYCIRSLHLSKYSNDCVILCHPNINDK